MGHQPLLNSLAPSLVKLLGNLKPPDRGPSLAASLVARRRERAINVIIPPHDESLLEKLRATTFIQRDCPLGPKSLASYPPLSIYMG